MGSKSLLCYGLIWTLIHTSWHRKSIPLKKCDKKQSKIPSITPKWENKNAIQIIQELTFLKWLYTKNGNGKPHCFFNLSKRQLLSEQLNQVFRMTSIPIFCVSLSLNLVLVPGNLFMTWMMCLASHLGLFLIYLLIIILLNRKR